jgi:hypothetical protein
MYQVFLGGLDARICTGIGLPVPLPPQALQRIMPEPSHVLQPTSLSDHRVHIHGTLRDPLHVGHWLNPSIGFSCSASKIDFITHAPARALSPCTTCVTAPGDILEKKPARTNSFQLASQKLQTIRIAKTAATKPNSKKHVEKLALTKPSNETSPQNSFSSSLRQLITKLCQQNSKSTERFTAPPLPKLEQLQ